ncbi:MAG: maleylpyruvate isomerase N-terminal domain-containing protein [Actinomycetota bacterium]
MTALHPDAVSVDEIRRHTTALVDVARRTPLDTPVPTCGHWNLGDLIHHLFEVQNFWLHIIGRRPAGPDTYTEPTRPADGDLVDTLERVNDELLGELAAADRTDTAWSWADEQTVGFTVRRQTHEALVHSIDGLLAAGLPLPEVSAELGADGVDELFGVMLSVPPDTEGYEADGPVIELHATDSDDRWRYGFGRLPRAGSDGATTMVSALQAAPDDEPAATVAADGLTLTLWLWKRADRRAVSITGDDAAVERLEALVSEVTG